MLPPCRHAAEGIACLLETNCIYYVKTYPGGVNQKYPAVPGLFGSAGRQAAGLTKASLMQSAVSRFLLDNQLLCFLLYKFQCRP